MFILKCQVIIIIIIIIIIKGKIMTDIRLEYENNVQNLSEPKKERIETIT